MKKGSHHSEESKLKNSIAHIGMPSGNKGKTGWKPSKEQLQKMKEAKIGDKNPMYGKDLSGKNNPFYGRRHTAKARQQMRENHADVSGEKHPMWGLGGMPGKANPAWRDGRSKTKYASGWGYLAKTIRLRDNGLCVLCGEFDQTGRKPSVHHIDCNKKNDDPLNLVTLCTKCHRKIHASKDSEQDYEIILSNWVRQKYGFKYDLMISGIAAGE